MTGRPTRRSTRLSVSKPVPEPPVVNRTRFRNTKSTHIASESESDDSDDVEANIENVNTNRPAAVRGRKPAAAAAAASAATSVVGTPSKKSAAKVTVPAKMPAKRKSTKEVLTTIAQADNSDDSSDEAEATDVTMKEKSEATPPKQAKFTSGGGEKKLSPVSLLDKLCLTSPKSKPATSKSSKPTDPSTTPPATPTTARSKYQNARITLNSAETYSLPGRERELQELTEFLSDGLRHQRSASMYISGPPGTGKTASLSKLLNASEFTTKFHRVYVNCTSIASIGSIYKKVCAELKLRGGTEKECLQSIERHLDGKHRTILMVLDEVDQLVGKKQSVLYSIFEWPARPNSNMLLIGIANSLDLTDRCLSRLHAKCELKPRLMHFAPYSKEQIIGIFKARLEEAGVLDLFPPVTIQLLAAKVASISGDVRRALDIGRRVIEMAEEQKRGERAVNLADLGLGEIGATQPPPPVVERVEIKQVMQVLNQVYGASQTFGDDVDDTFPLQQKILICTVLLILRCDKNKDITVGRLEGVYSKVCATRNIAPVGRNEFSGLCELVATRGIVRIIKNKEPRLCKVQMQWDEQEVTAALQDKQMIASILSDTSCVRGK